MEEKLNGTIKRLLNSEKPCGLEYQKTNPSAVQAPHRIQVPLYIKYIYIYSLQENTTCIDCDLQPYISASLP